MIHLNIRIRPESAADAAAIESVTALAFLNAPHTDHTEQHIVRALRQAGALSVSLVAEAGAQIVGHVALSSVTVSDGATGWFGLGPLSVLPDWQGKGIGSELVRRALGQLRAQHAAGCVLLGEPGYYRRFGFRPEPGLLLPGVPAEYFQALSLGGRIPQGQVTYHAGFGATS